MPLSSSACWVASVCLCRGKLNRSQKSGGAFIDIATFSCTLPYFLVLRNATEAVASTFAVRNHWAVADAIGTCTAATGGTGHPSMTKRIVVCFSLVLFNVVSHYDHLVFSSLAAFQVIRAD